EVAVSNIVGVRVPPSAPGNAYLGVSRYFRITALTCCSAVCYLWLSMGQASYGVSTETCAHRFLTPSCSDGESDPQLAGESLRPQAALQVEKFHCARANVAAVDR